jgi:hypothetical protein
MAELTLAQIDLSKLNIEVSRLSSCPVCTQPVDSVRINGIKGVVRPAAASLDITVTTEGGWTLEPCGHTLHPELAQGGWFKTPDQWCDEYDLLILDPDGWRGKDAPRWDTPITLAEFYRRAMQCTVSRSNSAIERIEHDLKVNLG